MSEFDSFALPVTDYVSEVLDVCRDTVQGEVSTAVLSIRCHGGRL